MMPFRVPNDYDSVSLIAGVGGRDLKPGEVRAYIEWLERELGVAREYLSRTVEEPDDPPTKSPKK